MKKRSVLAQIVLNADGSVQMKFLKQVVDDDGTVIASVPHIARAEAWEDPVKVMAFADERLSLKHAPVASSDKEWLASVKRKK